MIIRSNPFHLLLYEVIIKVRKSQSDKVSVGGGFLFFLKENVFIEFV